CCPVLLSPAQKAPGLRPKRLQSGACESGRSPVHLLEQQRQSMPYPNWADRVNLPPDRRHSIHLPPLCPSANHVPVLPWRDAVYAAWSRLSHTFSVPGPVAVPKRWPRSSGWSPTTWLETTIAEKCGCPERLSLPSPRSDADTHDTAAIPS